MTNPRIADIKNYLKDIEKELQTPGCTPLDVSSDDDLLFDSDLSDTHDIDDGLSDISDMSSIASMSFSFVPPSKKEKNRKKSSKPAQSRIPVPVRAKNSSFIQQKDTKNTKKQQPGVVKLAKPIKCSSPPPAMQPINFLAPDLTQYSKAAVCIFEGTGFPKSRYGERSTYVVVNLHPDIPSITSPVCFNKTDHAIYNGGFNLDVMSCDFSNVIPMVEVYDFISQEQRELIGVAFIQLHMARTEDNVCIVLQDEWIDIFTVNTRTKCGQIRLSLIFHDDADIPSLVKKSEYNNKPKFSESKKEQAKIAEEETNISKPVMKESISVQAEVIPINSRPAHNEEMMDEIGNLSLTFGSPIKMWNTPSYEHESDYIPVKQPVYNEPPKQKSKPEIRPKKKKPSIHFIDEIDLDISDDSSTIPTYSFINPKKSHKARKLDNLEPKYEPVKQERLEVQDKPVIQLKNEVPEKIEKQRVPLQPIVNENSTNVNEASKEIDLRKRFARYSDFDGFPKAPK